jgi:hypothetical protein
MRRFMVISAPRSGSAWCANWLSTETVHTRHDPLWDTGYWDFDSTCVPGKRNGIACTGIAYFHQWVNTRPCPKVILHRPIEEIDASLAQLGLPAVNPRLLDNLWEIVGLHVEWSDLFKPLEAVKIHDWLRLGAFNRERYDMLRHLKVTSNYWERVQNPAVARRLQAEMA